ncbi:MAG: (deoxy)nucleoside triphosphate pyrophosphohydrolase [Geodermatophilaceae bacterium]
MSGVRLVVAAAILDGTGQVLAAQRAAPPELAGQWEFPGGKVEDGESEQAALVRECREELGVVVRPGQLIAAVPIPGGRLLRLWTAKICSGVPTVSEHLELRWVAAAELQALPWLVPDRPLLTLLEPWLAGRSTGGAAGNVPGRQS